MINGFNEKRLSKTIKSFNNRCFSVATIACMYLNLIPLLQEKPAALFCMWVPKIRKLKIYSRFTINC